ncbi:MAG TPA: tetratricopeptide repeat protein [Alphaproteobacteria bacterium]|nr:tetratricopeptide repeat protein [Alphaproteobacteria bacterium]
MPSDRDYRGLTVSLIGAPERVPLARIRRELERRGAVLMRRIVYDTQVTVVAHGAVGRLAGGTLDGVLARAGLRSTLQTEHQFLRELGLLEKLPEKRRDYERAAFSRLSRLAPKEQMWLELFDAIEPVDGFFDFPDVVLARQVRSLLDAGLSLPSIIGAVIAFRRAAARDAFGQIGNLVQLPSGEIVVRMGAWLAEIDGQLRLPLEDEAPPVTGELYDLAEAAEQVGDWVGAERLYRRCIQVDPNDALSHYNCANALRQQNRAQEAAILFARATALDPQLADGWYNLACLAQDRGDLDTAQRHFERAIACDPNYADALFNLAVLHLDRGKPAEALPLFERYAAQDPHSRWGRAARKAASLCRLYLTMHEQPG